MSESKLCFLLPILPTQGSSPSLSLLKTNIVQSQMTLEQTTPILLSWTTGEGGQALGVNSPYPYPGCADAGSTLDPIIAIPLPCQPGGIATHWC